MLTYFERFYYSSVFFDCAPKTLKPIEPVTESKIIKAEDAIALPVVFAALLPQLLGFRDHLD